MRFGASELLVILGLTLLIFGPKRLPELGKGLGESLSGFRKYANRHDEVDNEIEDEDDGK